MEPKQKQYATIGVMGGLVLFLIFFFMMRGSSNTTDTATLNREESKVARIETQTELGDDGDTEVASDTAKNRSRKTSYTHYNSIATTQAISKIYLLW